MEKKLISALLINNDNMKYAYGKVRPEMFLNPICKEMYKTFLANYLLGIPTNIIDIQQLLADMIYTKEETNAVIKEILSEDVLGESEKESVVKGIVDGYKAREFKNLIDHSSFSPSDIYDTAAEIYRVAEAMLNDEKPRGRSVASIMEEYKDYYGKEHPSGIKTGLYELDEIINGLEGGDVTVLAARPAVGKSALVTQIITTVANKGLKVGYFNEEMTEQQILERMMVSSSKIHLQRLRKAISFMTEEAEAYEKSVKILTDKSNVIIFSGSHTANEIKSLCKSQEFDLVVIDYLQLVKADRNYGNRVAEVGDISKTIKSLAMSENVPVIALSQLNRRIGPTDEPSMSDLRESGDIEQDASNIILMWNLDENGKYKGLKVDKNRQGELGKVALEFKGETMSFDTINHKTIEQIQKECKVVGKTDNGNPFR